jgi:Gas vesicle protein K
VKKRKRKKPPQKSVVSGFSRTVAAKRRPVKKVRRAKAIAAPMRWNPDPDDVQKSVVKLVLSLIEFIRRLMERQAVRRLEAKTLSAEEIENVGLALMKLEETVRQIAKRFKLNVEDLNLDLGPIGRLH